MGDWTPGGWATVVSVALFVVWMQRHRRWHLFLNAMQGQYSIRE